jgi:hypothetical protein
MGLRRLRFATVAFVVAGSMIGGCWLWRSRGEAVVHWTIDGATDPTACVLNGADRVEIHAIDAWGHTSASATPACTAFTTSLWLDDGWYHVDATLIDGRGRAVSTTTSAGPFEVVHDERGYVQVDFGFDAFVVAPLSRR